MKYRLALKLAYAGKTNGLSIGGALGWAVLKLKESIYQGSGNIPLDDMEGPGEVRVLVYDEPAEMLEPMPLDVFEKRLRSVLKTLPKDCVVIRVRFRAADFAEWARKQAKLDTHDNRAAWANEQL